MKTTFLILSLIALGAWLVQGTGAPPGFTNFLVWTDGGARVNTADRLVWTDYGAHVE